jgi:uncharacterized protein (DUF2164 family)
MPITLSDDARKQALASIRRYCAENLDLDLETGDLKIALLLDFFLKEIAPSVYNAAVVDAQVFVRDRLADLEATCYEPEFVYWPKSSSVRRK